MSTRDELSAPGVERLLTLSDGVVAIALTLLVLQLAVPNLSDPTSPSQLARALNGMGGRIFVYVVAFFVIGQFWLAHHRAFRLIAGHHESLAWANFLFLFTITLLPFTSNLLGRYGENPLAIDIFALNMMLASLATAFTVTLAKWRGLMAPDVTNEMLRPGRVRTLTLSAVLVVSMAIAWVSTGAAKDMWLLLTLVPWVARWTVGTERRIRRQEA